MSIESSAAQLLDALHEQKNRIKKNGMTPKYAVLDPVYYSILHEWSRRNCLHRADMDHAEVHAALEFTVGLTIVVVPLGMISSTAWPIVVPGPREAAERKW